LLYCTFTPNINKTKRKSEEQVEKRLIKYGKQANQKKQLLVLDQEIINDKEYMSECTFHPKINQRVVKTKYSDKLKKSNLVNQEFTFSPKINSIARFVKADTKNAFERLYTVNIYKSPRETPKPTKPKFNLEEFINRQRLKEVIKQQRITMLSNNVKIKSTPKTNKRSEAVSSKLRNLKTKLNKFTYELQEKRSHSKINPLATQSPKEFSNKLRIHQKYQSI